MGRHSGWAAAVGGAALAALSVPALAYGQAAQPVARFAAVSGPVALSALSAGFIAGTVHDERGVPKAGAMVSAFGETAVFAETDGDGQFQFSALPPGSYLVRAHLSGYVAAAGQIVDVRAGARASLSLELRRLKAAAGSPAVGAFPVAQAGVGAPLTATAIDPAPAADEPGSTPAAAAGPSGDPAAPSNVDRSEAAWRLSHARRGVLRDATVPETLLVRDEPPANVFGRAAGSSVRMATSFFSGVPLSELSGQFNLLTTGSFDGPQQLFTTDSFSRSVAYMSLGGPAGGRTDWSMRGALTQGDVSSWIVAAAYAARAPAQHRYDTGFSYSVQRYDATRPAALGDAAGSSRNVGEIYGSDTFTPLPAVSLTYGARLARYDYLEHGALMSPRLALTLTPVEHLRMRATAGRRALAPGAEEFLPPADGPLLLPPQRTFSSLIDGRPLQAEHTSHLEFEVERDLAAASTVTFRVFRQHVTDQLVTVFGVDAPDAPPARLGHYFVGNNGDVDAAGWSAAARVALAGRLHGSVEYSQANTRWNSSGDLAYVVLLAPFDPRTGSERIHEVSTSIETQVPETATRVIVLCRVGNGFASGGSERPGFDSRFDVQVRQSLPFMDFSSARWEMLVAVRNFHRDAASDSSVYDELLVVRPPKRIVGGLALRF